MSSNKRKIINDPVYGFIPVPDDVLFDIIEHRYFQRLRRIKQLGLTHLVYPGALHTRFHHALGAMYLVKQAAEVLRWKAIEISPGEERGVLLAILLHDIGHGPFSHALENCLVFEMSHEDLSVLFMERLNEEFNGLLTMAIDIFLNRYPKKFLHQLISGQLDMDRMDYLKRDSFYTGVSEGVINSDRLLNMLTVVNDELVVEAKGIYSVEKFIVARRLMYWQVYLHKTVLAAEQMLVHTLKRAKILAEKGIPVFATPSLSLFLENRFTLKDFINQPFLLDEFALLDDSDISASIKVWSNHPDPILSELSRCLVERRLFAIEIGSTPVSEAHFTGISERIMKFKEIKKEDLPFFLYKGEIANNAYNPSNDKINILQKNGTLMDIAAETFQLNIASLSEIVTNFYLCYPKEIRSD
ncbi:MAG: HD domain-containing protein [Bacteroidetes bacterium]|nr:HD domain-containing protein [Bacteroidota bacterium]